MKIEWVDAISPPFQVILAVLICFLTVEVYVFTVWFVPRFTMWIIKQIREREE